MIEIVDLCKKFDNKILFDRFSLTIPTGGFFVIAGRSGCGKTTLLNTIGGLEKPDSGSVFIDGENLYAKKSKRSFYLFKVGFLFQNFALIEDRTVRENLELVQKKARSGVPWEEALNFVGLRDKADTAVYKLSGGEQQRVALARLMFKRCDILLADEPTGSLDSENAQLVLRLMHGLCETGKTVVLVTHNEKIMETERNVIRL